MLNPIVAMLHNTTTNRYHPILFHESPLPGPHSPDKPVRHKSTGHHTAGFDSREDAMEAARKLAVGVHAKTVLEKDFSWDGEDTPVMVMFFVERDGKIEPILM